MSSVEDLLSKNQRHINRVSDSDKSTRKMGLSKLHDDLPWSTKKKETKVAIITILRTQLLKPLLKNISDSVEKCREISLNIINKSIDILDLSNDSDDYEIIEEIVKTLCNRINEIPFPEATEELRLLILTILSKIVTAIIEKSEFNINKINEINESIMNTLPKSLTDAFPAAKKQAAELLYIIASSESQHNVISAGFKSCLKALSSNAMHQHNKVRTATLRALCASLKSIKVQSIFQEIMRDSIMPLLLRMLSDRSVITRRELAYMCTSLVEYRITHSMFTTERQPGIMGEPDALPSDQLELSSWSGADIELLRLGCILAGDDADDTSTASCSGMLLIAKAFAMYPPTISTTTTGNMNEEFTGDAEAVLQASTNSDINDENILPPPPPVEAIDISNLKITDTQLLKQLVTSCMRPLLTSMAGAVDNWTTEARCRTLAGIKVAIDYAGSCSELSSELKLLLAFLGPPLRDDESSVRNAAEKCCYSLGACVDWKALESLLLDKARGEISGSDTASQRATAIRLLTSLLLGASSSSSPSSELVSPTALLGTAAQLELYEHREAYLREAIILLVRAVVKSYPILNNDWKGEGVNATMTDNRSLLALALVQLVARLPGESSDVSNAALSLAMRLDSTCTDGLNVFEGYFPFLLEQLTSRVKTTTTTVSELWNSMSPEKGAFDVLLRELPSAAWKYHLHVMPIIIKHLKPRDRPDKDSAEAIAASYASQRGEEEIPDLSEVDVRLSMLASLEALVRSGNDDWQCAQYIGAAAEVILSDAVVPNLVWRVGRVEATIRKVALAVAHGLLRSGGLAGNPQALFKAAPHLVPLLGSNLDDHDAGPRAIACLCLTSCFQRLRGAFNEESVKNLYPMLLKRLDDSSDQVRVTVCGALEEFLVCAPVQCYKGTLIDYTLDQLYVHLDDPSSIIQNAVLKVILVAARVDPSFRTLVEKKADSNRSNHRSPIMCDKVFTELQGYEVIEG